MARTIGRHRISRRTKVATGLIGLAMAAGGLVVATTTSDTGQAGADPASKSFFEDITAVKPNVNIAKNSAQASTGTFTVDCGENQNGHFNPDNFIAQPGIKNGAQHLHDYVGNLTTNADSTNASLIKGGTTCKNGDQSAYFWPVIRIDQGDDEAAAASSAAAAGAASSSAAAPSSAAGAAGAAAPGTGGGRKNRPRPQNQQQLDSQRAQDQQQAAAGQVDCPDVASQLPDVPDQAQNEVNDNLTQLDQQVNDANQRLASTRGQGGPNFAQNAVLGPLKDKRTAAINRIGTAMGRFGRQPQMDVNAMATCAVEDANGNGGLANGGKNSNGNTNNNANDANGDQAATDLPGASGADQEVGINDGTIVEPEQAILTFRGNATGPVTAMPQFLRILSGDAKPAVNGTANTRAAWTCTGFENRIIDKYPICPAGSKVERIHDFPSCWDGKNIDSANHRDHIVFPDAAGNCTKGFKAVPQLRVTLIYDIPTDVQQAGEYKVDSFAEEEHNPLSDHDDFANVMSQGLMNQVVTCINRDKVCNS